MNKSGASFVTIIIIVLICAIVIGAVAWRLTRERPTPPSETGENIGIKRTEIKTEAAGEIIEYREVNFYPEDNFAAATEDKDKFSSQLIENFKERIIRANAKNCKVSLDRSKNSVVLTCDIEGAVYDTKKYNMHFLLGNWPFDLYQFEEYEKKLVYERKIDGVPTSIVFEFPYAYNHCCEHVWPE